MNVYKVTYSTISRGKNPTAEPGNVLQFTGTAFIEADSISGCDSILEKYYKTPLKGQYYVPIIKTVELQKNSIVLKGNKDEQQIREDS